MQEKPKPSRIANRWLVGVCWVVAVILGAAQTWAGRHSMNPDGISYLDMGDAFLRGDWAMAINAYWSPLYSWPLGFAMAVFKPSPYWEFSVAHVVNFVIYLCALGCFHFFLLQLIRYHRSRTANAAANECVSLAQWEWLVLGYMLFIWSSLQLIALTLVTPDLCVAAFTYLAAGILLRIRMKMARWPTFVCLGVVLGLGYLAKAAMFPLAFMFMGVAMAAVGNMRRALRLVSITFICFLLVGGPLIIGISKAKGRLTYGDAGKVNYAYYVNHIKDYVRWQGEPAGSGTPKHPARKMTDLPAVYEFATPVGGTFPLHYDPSYWCEGVAIRLSLKKQLDAFRRNLYRYYQIFRRQITLIVGFAVLCFMGRRRWLCLKDIPQHWVLLIPAIVPMAMYSLVFVGARFIAASLVLLWTGLFCSVRLPASQRSRRVLACVTIAMTFLVITPVGVSTVQAVYESSQDTPAHVHWEIADAMHGKGIQAGDRVAFVGSAWFAYWARLGRICIIADIPAKHRWAFWQAGDVLKSERIRAIEKTGVKAIVADRVPSYADTTGWQRIGATDHYVYVLHK